MIKPVILVCGYNFFEEFKNGNLNRSKNAKVFFDANYPKWLVS